MVHGLSLVTMLLTFMLGHVCPVLYLTCVGLSVRILMVVCILMLARRTRVIGLMARILSLVTKYRRMILLLRRILGL